MLSAPFQPPKQRGWVILGEFFLLIYTYLEEFSGLKKMKKRGSRKAHETRSGGPNFKIFCGATVRLNVALPVTHGGL